MMKLVWLAIVALAIYRMVTHRWPWQAAGADRQAREDIVRARNLLGVSEGAGREEIVQAHRRLIMQVHPDRGGTESLVHEANAARDLLLARAVQQGKERS